jgi:hypothetical protein
MSTSKTLFLLSLLALTAACEGEGPAEFDHTPGDEKGGPGGKAEAWGEADSPFRFDDDIVVAFAELPTAGEATKIPWAASYWPVYEDSINVLWDGPESSSAAAKYGEAFGVEGVEDAVSRYHGIDSQYRRTSCSDDDDCDRDLAEACAVRAGESEGYCIPTWFGICHAWAPAAIMYDEPEHPVVHNGVEFKVNDIKALLTLANNRVDSEFVSLRCNHQPDDIELDENGRPIDNSCRYTNPATYHILLANYLGIRGEGFVEDRTMSAEVWNQPIRSFEVTEQRRVTEAEANALIGVATSGETAEASGTLGRNEWERLDPIEVSAGESINVELTGNGDADLYVNFGSEPSHAEFACRPYLGGSAESCNLTATEDTTLYVGVAGYADTSDFEVEVNYGSVSSNYHFNTNAAELHYIASSVRYIAESATTVDGNLADVIDNYTHTDRYEYILEVDANGDLIGGEWVGRSKLAHPDFLWLPTGLSLQSVAGGAITWANVETIYEASITAQDDGGDDEPTDDAGACCEANGSPGCEDTTCETAVCDEDPYCCNTEWDGICGDLAQTLQSCTAACG